MKRESLPLAQSHFPCVRAKICLSQIFSRPDWENAKRAGLNVSKRWKHFILYLTIINSIRREVMIKSAEWVVENDIILTYETESGRENIHFSEIEPYWHHATEDAFEGGDYLIDGNTIYVLLLVASSQGGVIFGWNAETKQVCHISEASYTTAFTVHDGYLYTLCAVMNFCVKLHGVLQRVPLGTKDAWADPETLRDISASELGDGFGCSSKISLTVDKNSVIIKLDDKDYNIQLIEDA